jgi:hypothetical protein
MAAIGSGKDAFLGAAAAQGLPVAGAGAEIDELGTMLDDQLSVRWPRTVIPDYPALAPPGSAPVEVPDWWHPNL